EEHPNAAAATDVAYDSTHASILGDGVVWSLSAVSDPVRYARPRSSGAPCTEQAQSGAGRWRVCGESRIRWMSDPATGAINLTPFQEIPRSTWAELAPSTASPLTKSEIVELQGLGDRMSLTEVSEVYLPLSRLISLYAVGAKRLHAATSAFLGQRSASTPFVIGVAGSVAVGKSTIARLLR